MIDFVEAVQNWSKIASEASFLGEIALSKPETDHYLNSLRSCLKVEYGYSQYSVPITVLSINCAYHYYDDNGFWKHFCEHLNINCDGKTQSSLGYIIEKYLRKLTGKQFDERYGPYRYVGRILEQCGVSKYYLEHFASFMKFLKGKNSWLNVSSLDCKSYKNCIPDGLPKFLSGFLHDISGYNFVVDVANSLSQYERKLINDDDLFSLSGYRPEFWADFLRLYDGTKIKSILPPSHPHVYGYIEPPFLYWKDNNKPKSLDFTSIKYVYMKPFESLCIGNFDSLLTGKYIFVCSISGKSNLIPVNLLQKSTDKVASLELNKLVINTPCEIEFWFEATGRTSGKYLEKQIGKWTCSLIDEISIDVFPQKLLAPEDYLKITIHGPENYQLNFPQPATNKSQRKEWMVPCNASRVSGEIIAGALEIPIEIPIHRDMLRMESGSKILLNQPEDMDGYIIIEGYPGNKVELVLQNDIQTQMIETGSRFGSDGNEKLSIKNNLGEALESWSGSWGLLSQETGTLDGCILYLNLPLLVKDIGDLWSYPDKFFNALPKNFSDHFKHLVDMASSQCRLVFDTKFISKFPEKLQNIAWILAACAKIFEEANILNLDIQDKHIPPKTRQVLLWYTKAHDLHTDEKIEDLNFLINNPPVPEAVYAPRWIEKVQYEQKRIAQLHSLQTDLRRQLLEWITEVKGTSQLTYDGVIAKLPDGQELTLAWRRFYHGKQAHGIPAEEVYSRAEELVEKPGVISALARILQLAVLRATGREHLMQNINVENIQIELRPDVQFLLDGTVCDKRSVLVELIV